MIERFKQIFSGLDRAHGVYKKGETQNGVKQKGKAFIKKEPVTDELWQKHLDGVESLGIIPVRDAVKDLALPFPKIIVEIIPVSICFVFGKGFDLLVDVFFCNFGEKMGEKAIG